MNHCDECESHIVWGNQCADCRDASRRDAEEAELDRLMKIQESKDYEGELAFHRRWG